MKKLVYILVLCSSHHLSMLQAPSRAERAGYLAALRERTSTIHPFDPCATLKDRVCAGMSPLHVQVLLGHASLDIVGFCPNGSWWPATGTRAVFPGWQLGQWQAGYRQDESRTSRKFFRALYVRQTGHIYIPILGTRVLAANWALQQGTGLETREIPRWL